MRDRYNGMAFEDIARTVGSPEVFTRVEAFQIRFLKHHGLRPDHHYLDLGCGVLRGGLPVIAYLDTGHYYGIDIDQELINIADHRVRKAGLGHKAPALMSAESFSDYRFPVHFDFILAYSVLIHLTDDLLDQCLTLVRLVIADQGTAYANVNIGVRSDSCWKRRFPVIWRPFDVYAAMCEKHSLSASLLDMAEFEKEHWTKHECLVVRRARE